MRKIDPLERAEAAYKALDVGQQYEFAAWLRGYEDAQKPAKPTAPEKRKPAAKRVNSGADATATSKAAESSTVVTGGGLGRL